MNAATPSRAALAEALEQEARRLCDLVRSALDVTVTVPDAPQWTVAEEFAHVVTVAPRYSKGPSGEGRFVADPRDLGALNDQEIAALQTKDVPTLAERLSTDVKALTDQIDAYGDDVPTFRFHGGETISADVALGILLGELLVHGRDIARALKQPWPIRSDRAAMALDSVFWIAAGWVDRDRTRGLTAAFELRLSGLQPVVLWFDDGRLTRDPSPRPPVDCRISADPTAVLLVLYKRVSQWPYILTGRMRAMGRKPWLAPTLVGRFLPP